MTIPTTRTPDAHLSAIAAAQHGVSDRSQAVAAGLTRSMLRTRCASGQFRQVSRHVFVVAGAPPTFEHHLSVARLEAGPGSVASHRSAAALHGIPGFDDGPIDITRLRTSRRPLACGHLHETTTLPRSHTALVQSIPVTSLPRTLFDLAAWSSPRRHPHRWPVVPLARVARAVDNAERLLGMNLDALDLVLEELAERGRPGTQITRMLLDERSDGFHATDSELEDLTLRVLRAHGVTEPETQVVLGDELPIGRVDFFFRAACVVLEADSRKFHLRMLSHDQDIERDQRLSAAGMLPVRVTWRQLRDDPHGFIGRLESILARNSR